MDIEQLSYLISVEEHGSILGASNHAHITQPSLSRSLKRLEKELGHELFIHGSNKVEFNEAGKIALAYAKEILNAKRNLESELAELDRKARTIKVGSIAPAPIWNLTARIIERFPGKILESDILDEDAIEPGLINRSLDLGIARKPSPLPPLISLPLMTEHLFLSAPLDSKFADKDWITWEEIDGETFLLYEQIGFWRSVVDKAIPNAEFVIQKDREVFLQLSQSTDLLCFTTDAPQNRGMSKDRKAIPIRDTSAHTTFYLIALADVSKDASDIIEWIHETA